MVFGTKSEARGGSNTKAASGALGNKPLSHFLISAGEPMHVLGNTFHVGHEEQWQMLVNFMICKASTCREGHEIIDIVI